MTVDTVISCRAAPGSWFVCPKPNAGARARLFCLPFAGGGASTYYGWSQVFPRDVEIRAIQLPGRESRMREPRILSARILAKEIVDVLGPYMDRPFALLGYSMGSLLAFEVARELRRQGQPLPVCLFVAAMCAPHVPKVHPPLSQLPREEFIEQIRYYYQPADEVWNYPEFLEMLLPILRDDIAIVDAYDYENEPPLACPIDVCVGTDDRGTPLATAEAWRHQTSEEFELTVFSGGHFFLHEALPVLQRRIWNRLNRLIGERK